MSFHIILSSFMSTVVFFCAFLGDMRLAFLCFLQRHIYDYIRRGDLVVSTINLLDFACLLK